MTVELLKEEILSRYAEGESAHFAKPVKAGGDNIKGVAVYDGKPWFIVRPIGKNKTQEDEEILSLNCGWPEKSIKAVYDLLAD